VDAGSYRALGVSKDCMDLKQATGAAALNLKVALAGSRRYDAACRSTGQESEAESIHENLVQVHHHLPHMFMVRDQNAMARTLRGGWVGGQCGCCESVWP